MIEEPPTRFMCPCLGPLDAALKKAKGESAHLELCEYGDFSSANNVTRVRGQHPMKFRCEVKKEVRQKDPDAKPKYKKQWVTRHYTANFCCMCGKPIA